MRLGRLTSVGFIGLALTAGAAIVPSSAEIRYDSSVRKAAVSRMQEKLGPLRGSIKPDAPNVRLTKQMIDLLSPIRAKDGVVEALPARPVEQPLGQSVSRSAPPPAQPVDRTYAASTAKDIANSAQAGSSDARSILAAVEEMMRNDP
ncbi:MAG: hypothetical protein AAF035_01785 [Pseudomonadota bacterium]